eukprot:SAG31_NODE_14819_length_786_cov_0.732169_3_plen_89_part_01
MRHYACDMPCVAQDFEAYLKSMENEAADFQRHPAKCPSCDEAHKFCIVGAGPAGVQLGEYLLQGGFDYVIVEKEKSAGSFFARLPVHRG